MAVQKTTRDLSRIKQMARGPIDLPFLMLTLILLGIGLIMLLSASSYAAQYDKAAGYKLLEDGTVQLGNSLFYFQHQLRYALVGVLAMVALSHLDYQELRKLALPLLAVSIVLLVLVKTPLGVSVNGSTRWLKILLVAGPTYQPSELAKIGVVLFFAASLSKRRYKMPEFPNRLPGLLEKARYFAHWSNLVELIPYLCILIVIIALLALQPHLSGMVLIAACGAAIMFAAGIRIGWFAVGGGMIAVVIYFVVNVIGYNSSRIAVWLDPWSDPGDAGYQIVQSLYAVASGGLTGLGFGLSRQKYLYLPEEQNDYIFAIICEELGYIGAMLIILLFVLLIIRGYWLALHARDRFGSLLIVGVITLLAVQVFLNIAVVLNLIPSTGISLPFFSYGGTALMIQLAEMGVVLAVSRQIPAPKQG